MSISKATFTDSTDDKTELNRLGKTLKALLSLIMAFVFVALVGLYLAAIVTAFEWGWDLLR